MASPEEIWIIGCCKLLSKPDFVLLHAGLFVLLSPVCPFFAAAWRIVSVGIGAPGFTPILRSIGMYLAASVRFKGKHLLLP